MKTTTQRKARTVILLAGLTLALGGCHKEDKADKTDKADPAAVRAKPHGGAMTVYVDLSLSTAMLNAPSYGDAAVKRVGDGVMQQQLGDDFRLIGIGNRSTDRAMDELSIRSGYAHRLPVVRKELVAKIGDMLARTRQKGGDGSTNILYTLENSHPSCAPGKLYIESDGIEASDAYSVVRALNEGKAVQLPAPQTPYLKGCTVEFIGIGIAPMGSGVDVQTLPNAQLQALMAGWRVYFTAAGVKPEDVHFASIL